MEAWGLPGISERPQADSRRWLGCVGSVESSQALSASETALRYLGPGSSESGAQWRQTGWGPLRGSGKGRVPAQGWWCLEIGQTLGVLLAASWREWLGGFSRSP